MILSLYLYHLQLLHGKWFFRKKSKEIVEDFLKKNATYCALKPIYISVFPLQDGLSCPLLRHYLRFIISIGSLETKPFWKNDVTEIMHEYYCFTRKIHFHLLKVRIFSQIQHNIFTMFSCTGRAIPDCTTFRCQVKNG